MKKCNYCHGKNEKCHYCFGFGYEDKQPTQKSFQVKNKVRIKSGKKARKKATPKETNFEELSINGIRDNNLRNKKNNKKNIINKNLQEPRKNKKPRKPKQTEPTKLPKKIRAIRGVLGKELFDAYFYSSVSSFSDIVTQLNILFKRANLKTKITIGDLETFHGVKSSSKKSKENIHKKTNRHLKTYKSVDTEYNNKKTRSFLIECHNDVDFDRISSKLNSYPLDGIYLFIGRKKYMWKLKNNGFTSISFVESDYIIKAISEKTNIERV